MLEDRAHFFVLVCLVVWVFLKNNKNVDYNL